VEEVDVHPVDLGRELRQRVQSGLDPPQVVVIGPIPGQLLERGQLHTLGPVGDQLPGGPAGRREAAAKVSQVLIGNTDLERTDGGVLGRCAWLGRT
jgi:hypothetical protein